MEQNIDWLKILKIMEQKMEEKPVKQKNTKVTKEQWDQILTDVNNGMEYDEIAKKYNITINTIRNRIEKVKKMAEQKIINDINIKKLEEDISNQTPINKKIFKNFYEQFKVINDNLSESAISGAKTSNLLSALAYTHSKNINMRNVSNAMRMLNEIAMLQKTANIATEIAFNLLKAQKEEQEVENKNDNEKDLLKEIAKILPN